MTRTRTLIVFFALLCWTQSTCSPESEYEALLVATEDKFGLESIRLLHKQLDDDKDGYIEPSETGDFIRADLRKDKDQQQVRQSQFHNKDVEITVGDLWATWRKSEVHNWTVDQTINWLRHSVELPQYEDKFRENEVIGRMLPQVAVNTSFLTKTLNITSSIFRSKLSLKAMDVVLFGPPKEKRSSWKDTILTSLLILALSCLLYAHRQNKLSQAHLKKMSSDMEGLSKAEEELHNLQLKYQQREVSQPVTDALEEIEVSKLKEEVEVLRNELQRAETELEDRCWIAPPVLQNWLQLTYELESQVYNAKKKLAEDQLETAKDLCEKLKKKRSSLVGAFVSTHGCSIDEVDKSILDAKKALLEVTQDLAERTQRWRQIEALCGCPIVMNPGIGQLRTIVRAVTGAGRALRLSDQLHDETLSNVGEDIYDDSRSIISSRPISMVKSLKSHRPLVSGAHGDVRESAHEEGLADSRNTSSNNLVALINANASIQVHPKVTGPGGKKMIKSLSHGAGSSMATLASAVTAKESTKTHPKLGISASVSDTHLQNRVISKDSVNEWIVGDSLVDINEPKPSTVDDSPDGSNVSGSCADESIETEESGSDPEHVELEQSDKLPVKKAQKLKNFFTFGKKKEKVV